MVSRIVKIVNPTGLHLQTAGVFCQEADRFKSKITFRYGKDNTASAKSVLSVLGANVKMGDEIELICDGEDEEEASEHMIKIIENGFQTE